MLERPLHYLAVVCSLLVVAGFGLWAIQEMGSASDGQRSKLAKYEQTIPSASGERQREQRNSTAREWIDDANDVLLSPFDGIVRSDNRWAARGVPALLGLLVYGFLLAFLARYARGWGSAHSLHLRERHDHA